MSTSSPVTPAPGELEFVRAFVNTLDIESGIDRLADATSWAEWAAEYGVGPAATAAASAPVISAGVAARAATADPIVSTAELHFARELREALRDALLANHDRAPLPSQTIEALDSAADRAHLAVRFTPAGSRLTPAATGMGAVYGRVVASVAAALADGTWSRLKACSADDCHWGFYDTSRSRTGQWCSMSICGNRAKQARWRRANAPSADAPSADAPSAHATSAHAPSAHATSAHAPSAVAPSPDSP